MSAAVETESPAASLDRKSEKRSKKHKNPEKKRPREDDELAATPRKHKRSKSEAPADREPRQNGDDTPKPKKKKSKKLKVEADEDASEAPQPEPAAAADEAGAVEVDDKPKKDKKAKKSKKEKRKSEVAEDALVTNGDSQANGDAPAEDGAAEVSGKKKKRERRKSRPTEDAVTDEAAEDKAQSESTPAKVHSSLLPKPEKEDEEEEVDSDRMDVDSPPQQTPNTSTSILQPPHAPANPEFPFMTQTVSLYVPLYPVGFDQPLTKVAEQHLKPLLNHYSPLLKGVLLDYRHVTLAETPTRADPRAPPTDRTPTVLACVDEYAVGFGWLTAEVYLFVPRRGAWMEGTVNLHSEGHLGVVCWGRFNASLEARRVPKGWRFVDVVQRAEDAKKAKFRNAGRKAAAADGGDAMELSSQVNGHNGDDQEDDQENLENSLQQMHATGYWVDEEGRRVQGKLRFRIKNYDVGMAGDHGYISIEGTMLDDEAEKALLAKERERERARKARNGSSGMLRRETRPVPQFSVTSFGREEEEEDNSKSQPRYIASRPGTPDD